ncbi:MAG: hypothetical protein Q9M35_11690 [Rhodothermus sp.]|nr:hypothetical protein [Rhodothermus sp.]
MTRIRAHIAPSVSRLMLGLLVLFPLGPHTLTGLLLCIEAGGRVHVEGVTDSDCAAIELLASWEGHPVFPAVFSTQPIKWQRVDSSVACIDVPFLLSPTDGYGQVARGQAVVQVVAAAVSILWISWDLVSGWTPPFHLTSSSFFFTHPFTSLRTVILLL